MAVAPSRTPGSLTPDLSVHPHLAILQRMNKTACAALILLASVALAGCGNKGPLFLPPPPPAEEVDATVEPDAEDEVPVPEDVETPEPVADGDSEGDPAGDANG